MFGIGMQELIIIAIIALLVVGPKRLPDLAKSLGKGFSEFKKAAEDVSEGVKSSLQADDEKKEAEEPEKAGTGPETDTENMQRDPDIQTDTASAPSEKPLGPSHSS